MKTIDITKPVKTRGGLPVTIISDKGRGDCPLVGYVGDSKSLVTWARDGTYLPGCGSNMNLVQESEVWANVYADGTIVAYHSKEYAKMLEVPIARVRMPYITGQFDE